MARCSLFLLFWLLALAGAAPPGLAEQVVERQGWKVLSFDVPGMELRGRKESRLTRATYAKKVGEGEVKIHVTLRSWMGIDTFEKTYREERTRARAAGSSRLRPDLTVPGASQAFAYSETEPYTAEIVVLYTKDFRCQLTVTSSSHPEARAALEPTFQQLLGTLTMRGLSPITPIRVESDSEAEVEE